jgi:hypothetical protein
VLPVLGASDIGLVLFYLVVLLVPGLLLGAAARLRGLSLVAAAPLLTYAVAGLAGPWSTALGIGWSTGVLAVVTLAFAALVLGLRLLAGRFDGERPPLPRAWDRADPGVAGVVVAAAVLGASAVLGGLRRISTIPQDWDAVFHANGIRWIAERGDAGLFGMSRTNWYEPGTAIFYPNAYHIVGANVRQLTERDLPAVLNAHTALLPGLAALVLAALVRRFGGSAVHAAGAALAAASVSALYDMLWRGPLLPYTTGAVLTPLFVVLVADLLDADRPSRRAGAAALLALGVAGLLCLHPAMLFGATVLAAPYVLVRWVRRWRALPREVGLVVLAVGAGLGLSAQQIAGSLYSAGNFPPVDWPADLTWDAATVQLLTFSHAGPDAQWWPTVLGAVGLLVCWRLRGLAWVVVPLIVFGTLFVLAASLDEPWVNSLTRPWWNDRWRLAGVFALLACVLVGHGLAQLHVALTAAGRALLRRSEGAGRRVRPVLGVLVLAVFVLGSGVLYLDRNATKMAINTGEGPAVSSDEVAAMRGLADVVPPGARVLNDRYDGSVWMYALSGVEPVAGHYDGTGLGETDVGLLQTSFNRYLVDPDVRAAVRRLDVQYVYVGQGFLRGDGVRAPGLTDLDALPFLTVAERTEDAVLYRIETDDARAG